jgi:hypothetical protein
MRSPSRIWPDLSGSRLFRRSARSCSISRIYSSQVVTRASAGAGLRSHHYAACQSIRLDRSRNGPKNAQSANPNNGYGNSNIPCATEAPSAIRAPTGGAIPGRNRGGRRVSVLSSNAEPRGRCAGATVARAGSTRTSTSPELAQCGLECCRQIRNIFRPKRGPIVLFEECSNWHVHSMDRDKGTWGRELRSGRLGQLKQVAESSIGERKERKSDRAQQSAH